MSINERISKLRELMKEKNIDAYIIPTYDPHQSEYLAEHYNTRVFISGFTGSAGVALVTMNKAILWTDGRYFIQAEKEIAGSEFELYKMGIPGYPNYMEWLKENLKDGDVIGVDGKIYPQSDVEKLKEEIGRKKININIEHDLIGNIWTDRPEEPKTMAFVHELKYTGYSAREKIKQVREELKRKEASHTIIGSLDDIAWLYNIRGRDIECNPVVISYAIISLDKAYLFVNQEKIDSKVRQHLEDNGITIKPYDEVIEYVESIGENAVVYLYPQAINTWLYNGLNKNIDIIKGLNITTELKAIKNETEIKNQKNAYLKDGAALVKFLYWLDTNIGKTKITEVSAATKLENFRREQEGFVEPSFETIAGYRENAAMMHYKAEEGKSNAELKAEHMLLVDSGGQYFDGTTDITRTIVLGELTEEEKIDYTLTLKGHTNLLTARFLYGTTGSQLDVLSRYPLWQVGLDYKCGTGHGVGYFLNVHEGPHRIANRPNKVTLEEGMVVTIEPGVYKEGKHGIRIENDVVVKKDINTEYGGQFMKFEVLSYCPIDTRAILVDMLSEDERAWINSYHSDVYDKLSSLLEEDERKWLKEATKEI